METIEEKQFSSAVGRMEEEAEIAAASWEDAAGDDWDGLERLLSELALADMAAKAQLLESLSSFLSCVAATMSFSREVNALSAWVGSSAVFLGHKEVAQLHELVVRELKDQTFFLSAMSWISNKQMDEGADANFTRVLNVKIVSQTLRCCIRILPLVDCFDKNASLDSTKLLDGLLQQLCHPAKLFHLLELKASQNIHSGTSYQMAQGDLDGTYLEDAESHEAAVAIALDIDSQHRKELILAMLEVFLDDLLLHPDLIARLLWSREDSCRSLAQEQVTCRVKHAEASLEAAFVHVLLSLRSASFPQPSPGSGRKGPLVCNLSLPAGLILLENFSNEEVPPFYIAHIVRLLTRVLNDTAHVGFSQVDYLSRTRRTAEKNCWAGGVDWSYCSQDLLPNFDTMDDHFLTRSSPSEPTLNFASAVLEHAILLYSKISLASDTCAEGYGSSCCQTLEKSVLEFYLSKYTLLCDVFGGSPELNTTDGISGSGDIGIRNLNLYRDNCQCCSIGAFDNESDFPLEDGSGTIGFARAFMHQGLATVCYCVKRRNNVVSDKNDVKDTSGLVLALLQLMSCALKCIGKEVYTSTWLPDGFGDQADSECNDADFDKILHCVGFYLSLCLPSATGLFSMYHERQCGRAGENEDDSNPTVYAQGSLNILVGQAIVFFTNVLRGEVCRGASDEILKEYFHLAESLVALLLALDERSDSTKSASECGLICDCTLCENICSTSLEVSCHGKCGRCSPSEKDAHRLPNSHSTSSYLEEMVLSLRGMLQDLSEQQRPMPEFFLSFVFKQLSKRDALSLVAEAFNGGFDNPLEVLQPITWRAGFQTGLVTEILQLALSEPTKACSLFAFIVYMVDILQDHSSITATLSASEIVESVSWFETIACGLTLASQLVVYERRMFVHDGKQLLNSFISKMSQGIDRMLTEGTAAAYWLSDHYKTMPEEMRHKLAGTWEAEGTSILTGRYFGEAWNETVSLGKCDIFLGQVDIMRNAVEELASTVESSLYRDLTPLLEKGRIFFAALSDLLTRRKLAESQWTLHLSEPNQRRSLGTEPGSRLQANSPDGVLGCDPVDGCQQEILDGVMEEIRECQKTDGYQQEILDRVVEEIQECQQTDGYQQEILDRVVGEIQECQKTDRYQQEILDRVVEEIQECQQTDGYQQGILDRVVGEIQECKKTDGYQQEILDRVVEETQECQKTPASDMILVRDQTFQTEKVSCSEELSPSIENYLAGQDEVIITQSNEATVFPNTELVVSSTVVTVEKRQTRSATSLITQKLDTHPDGLGTEKPHPTPLEKKHFSASTSAIIKRLLRKNSPSRGKSTGSKKRSAKVSKCIPEVEVTSGREWASCDFMYDVVTDGDVPASTGSNLFVDSLNEEHPGSENFDDLKDFIVTKKGRDYSAWLKRRRKVRRRLYSKKFFKRLQEKKELLHFLDI